MEFSLAHYLPVVRLSYHQISFFPRSYSYYNRNKRFELIKLLENQELLNECGIYFCTGIYFFKLAKNAIQKYIDNNYNATKTVRELGYPSVPGLLKWYNAYYPPKSEKTVKPKKERRIYTPEEKQHAIDLYFKNGCNLKKTVRELGYGSQTGVLRWLRDTVPDKVSKPVPREWRVDYSEETKQSAVLELCSNELTPNELCQNMV